MLTIQSDDKIVNVELNLNSTDIREPMLDVFRTDRHGVASHRMRRHLVRACRMGEIFPAQSKPQEIDSLAGQGEKCRQFAAEHVQQLAFALRVKIQLILS